jgi:Leucine-rich repeat (LRR) protein
LCPRLSGDLSPLASLTSFQSLDLSWSRQLSGNLSSLTSLTSLQWLSLEKCHRLTGDLSPLAGLTSLQSLNLSFCGFRWFAPVESLLPTLKKLYLFDCKFDDLPSEFCGEEYNQNVVDKVRAHYEDLKSGQRIDAEVKVLFLGNGGVGKTQLCRRLRGEPFDEKNISTHGIELRDTAVVLEGFDSPVRLNLWDFGGQEMTTVPVIEKKAKKARTVTPAPVAPISKLRVTDDELQVLIKEQYAKHEIPKSFRALNQERLQAVLGETKVSELEHNAATRDAKFLSGWMKWCLGDRQ